MTPEIWGMLDGTDTRFGFAPSTANRIVDSYLAGHAMQIGVGYTPKKFKKRDLPNWEKLANLDEVWALCVRAPTNGYRIFGRLMERDMLVLSLPYLRDDLGSLANYEKLAGGTIDKWNAELVDVAPHAGVDLTDYFSGTVINVY